MRDAWICRGSELVHNEPTYHSVALATASCFVFFSCFFFFFFFESAFVFRNIHVGKDAVPVGPDLD